MSEQMIICEGCDGEEGWMASSHKSWCAEVNAEGDCDCGGPHTEWVPCEDCEGEGVHFVLG